MDEGPGGLVESGWGLALARLGLAVLWMGPTAFLLGGTFPVLCEALVARREELGRRATLLYAVNTLGAALGALLVTFVLLPRLGHRLSYVVALAAATSIALFFTRHSPRGPGSVHVPAGSDRRGPTGQVVLLLRRFG